MRFSRNTFASIHPDLHSGLDVVLLGVRVFYRFRFSPTPHSIFALSLRGFPPFFHLFFLFFFFFFLNFFFFFFFLASNFSIFRSNLDLVSSSLSRGIEFLSSLKLFCLFFSFSCKGGEEFFLVSFVLEQNISSTLRRQVSIKNTIG